MRLLRSGGIAALALVLGGALPPARAQAPAQPAAPLRAPDVIYLPTPRPVVYEMLKMARVRKGDVLYDLGSGDGRIPITAARMRGTRGVGIEIRPELVAQARADAQKAGVSHLVTFSNADLFETDLSEATVVMLYLLPSLNVKLRPKLLRELKPGSRIVSHSFLMGDWEPEQQKTVHGATLYSWTVPAPSPAGR